MAYNVVFRPPGFQSGLRFFSTGIGTITVAPAMYIDTFSTATALSARPNWTIQTAAQAAKWVTNGTYLRYNAKFDPANNVFFGPTVTDFVVTIGYDTSGVPSTTAWDETRQYFNVWYQDANNYVSAQITKSTPRLLVTGKIGGTALSQYRFQGMTWNSTGTMTLLCQGGKLRLSVDGKWVDDANNLNFPFDILDLTSVVPAANRTGYFGINQNAYDWAQMDNVALDPLVVTIDHIDQFVGRNSPTAGGGDCLVSGTYSGSPTQFVSRVFSANTKALVRDWQALGSVNYSNGTWSGLTFLPTGGPYYVEAGWTDSNGKTHTAISKYTLCGIRMMTWGQSNSGGLGSVMTSAAASTYVRSNIAASNALQSIANTPPNEFATGQQLKYQLQCAYEMAKQVSNALGIPVGINAIGIAGVSQAYLSPGGQGWSTFTTAVGQSRGMVEVLVWDQGEADADAATSPTTYASTFASNLVPGLKSATGNPNLRIFISPVGRYANSTQPYTGISAAQNDAQREVLRQQYLAIVANDPTISIAASKLGVVHTDAYHYTADQPGYIETSRRLGYSIAKALGANIADGRGAQATSATRSGATITIALDLNGGNGITGPVAVTTLPSGNTNPTPTLGNAVNGIQVSADNFATTLPINSVAISGTSLVVTLASAPSGPVSVRSHYGWSYNDESNFMTTYADGRANIPVDTIKKPLVTN